MLQDTPELALVDLLLPVKLDYPQGQGSDDVADECVVQEFLVTGCETAVYRHRVYIISVNKLNCTALDGTAQSALHLFARGLLVFVQHIDCFAA